MPETKIDWVNPLTKRELRALNIFGLSSCRYTRLYGQQSEDNSQGDHLAVMPSLEAGIHASIDEIRDHYLTFGFLVPYTFGNIWSGDKLKMYGVRLAQVMRVAPMVPVSFKVSGDLLLRACAIMENGDPCRNITPGFFGQFINEY